MSATRRRWAYAMVSRCEEPPPSYGSPDWLALPEGDVQKVAAVVNAAEAWAREGDDLEDTLRAEVEALRASHKALDDGEYVTRREEHRMEWQHLRLVRPHGEQKTPPRDLYDVGRDHMAGEVSG